MSHPGASPLWESMWSKGLGKGEAFDVGSASGTLVRYLSRTPKLDLAQGAAALVPGCGRAYDALALASHGYSRVVALDLSSTAVNAAKEELKTAADTEAAARVEVCCGDFFSYQGQFDLIWDCTFLCALEPSVRAEWAKQQKSLLKPGGLLLTCIFPIVDKEGGPPFAMSVPLVRDLVEAEGFECAELKEQLPEEEMHRPGGLATGPKTAFAAWKKPS
uniref:S-adenosyl-L-methionine-dependent methyltransferase n=1 Tax=Chrysotila carterae TaxID=13221 RepID=A0A7S4F4J4_CHRCT